MLQWGTSGRECPENRQRAVRAAWPNGLGGAAWVTGVCVAIFEIN